MFSSLCVHVIAVLEQAGYRKSEDSLPWHGSGGTFPAAGGDRTGVNVTWRCWDASGADLAELRAGIAAALRDAGFRVHEAATRLYVPRIGLEDAGPAT